MVVNNLNYVISDKTPRFCSVCGHSSENSGVTGNFQIIKYDYCWANICGFKKIRKSQTSNFERGHRECIHFVFSSLSVCHHPHWFIRCFLMDIRFLSSSKSLWTTDGWKYLCSCAHCALRYKYVHWQIAGKCISNRCRRWYSMKKKLLSYQSSFNWSAPLCVAALTHKRKSDSQKHYRRFDKKERRIIS